METPGVWGRMMTWNKYFWRVGCDQLGSDKCSWGGGRIIYMGNCGLRVHDKV